MTIHDNHYYTASMLCRRTPSFVSRLVSSTLSPGADPPGPDTPAVTSNSAPTGADSVGSTRINLMQLPLEILVGEILATLPLSDLASLVRVSKGMHHLCQSDYLWQRKFFKEFQYRPSKALRQLGGWKRIYQAMDRVEVYTWGTSGSDRL
ncbi:hypothetical protein BC939DRAFT_508774 [Gamsiella multidivaricata]|uniref:uncharacterized protein n=1 Tax=Gamsiella multidivaricata TaxID=101098 RepID=UPI00221F8C59|nr:uncharacterized protein BC939DRAFT_508774 [Gamsiella multidivaricata]KAG0367677.1 hypothetical protein BGZ54_003473 [Gamsiella multidivaricata]KAI7815962.1 hypothetical protein BC939DRAFT_508774 [Gamsiella multidivaricata]